VEEEKEDEEEEMTMRKSRYFPQRNVGVLPGTTTREGPSDTGGPRPSTPFDPSKLIVQWWWWGPWNQRALSPLSQDGQTHVSS